MLRSMCTTQMLAHRHDLAMSNVHAPDANPAQRMLHHIALGRLRPQSSNLNVTPAKLAPSMGDTHTHEGGVSVCHTTGHLAPGEDPTLRSWRSA